MEEKLYEWTYAAEEKHWWFIGMRKITDTLLTKVNFDIKGKKILDVGAGTGYNVYWFAARAHAEGIEPSHKAIVLARRRGVELRQGTAESLPYKDASFDLVTCFDVIYHKDVNPERAVSEMMRVLKPGGVLFIRNAAYQWMLSGHDKLGHTVRRFTIRSQERLCANFTVLLSTYANTFLFPLAVIKRILEPKSHRGKSNELAIPFLIINKVFTWVLFFEAFMVKFFSLPFGLSVITIVKK